MDNIFFGEATCPLFSLFRGKLILTTKIVESKEMTIQKINSQQCESIRKHISEALAVVEENLGLSVQLGCMRYTDETVKCTMDVRLKGVPSAEIKALEYMIDLFDLPNDLAKRELFIGGKYYHVTGCKPKARKNHFIITPLDGSANRVCPIESIHSALQMAKSA
ncbi:hypothetical protein ACPV5U_19260 [Vibrio mediterranei]